MKKIAMMMALATICLVGRAQTAQQLFNEYKDCEGVSYVQISQNLLKYATSFMDKDDLKDVPKGLDIQGITVLSFDEGCKASLREEFAAKVKKIDGKGLDELLTAKEDGECVHIYGKLEGDNVKNLLIFSIEKDECNFISLEGIFPFKELQEQYSKKD